MNYANAAAIIAAAQGRNVALVRNGVVVALGEFERPKSYGYFCVPAPADAAVAAGFAIIDARQPTDAECEAADAFHILWDPFATYRFAAETGA